MNSDTLLWVAFFTILVAFPLVSYFCYTVGKSTGEKDHSPNKTKVVHEYKTSTDYNRLWKLLHEGRSVITISNVPWSHYVTAAELKYNTIYGCGEQIDLKKKTDFTEEDFCMTCKLARLVYLDQIDKYETYLT